MQAGMRLKTLKLSFLFNSQNHNKSLRVSTNKTGHSSVSKLGKNQSSSFLKCTATSKLTQHC